MTSPDPFTFLAQQFDGSVNQSIASPVQEQHGLQFPDGPSQHPSHTFLHMPNKRYSDTHFPGASFCSTPIDHVNLDPVGLENRPFVFPESDFTFTSLNLTQDGAPWTTSSPQYYSGLLLAEDPVSTSILIPAPGSMLMFFKGGEQHSTNQR